MVGRVTRTEEHLDVAPPRSEQRRHKRKPVLWRARVETSIGAFDCIALDLSLGGAKLQLPRDLPSGEPVALVLEQRGKLAAEIAWQHFGLVGLHFTEAPEKIAHILGSLPLSEHPI